VDRGKRGVKSPGIALYHRGIFWPGLLLILGLFAGACRGGEIPQFAVAQEPLPAPDEQAAAATPSPAPEVPDPQPTGVFVAITEAVQEDQFQGGPEATSELDALRFVFPTQGAVPVSAWRPPLYQVPWALTPNDHFYFTRPIAADEVNWPLPDYRYGGRFFANVVHTGVDIPSPEGTPVLAAGSGKVIQAGFGVFSGLDDPEDPYGLAVVIRHDFGYQGKTLYTIYGHLSYIEVTEGQRVEPGDIIGLVGQTGFTTGPHLHFEVRVGENRFFFTRNPELWIAPPMGWGVLAGRVMNNYGFPYPGQTVYIQSHETGQVWQVKTYGGEAVKSDEYYQENLVIGDLPAGNYDISIAYLGILYEQAITIKPGMVNYFTFQGRLGFGEPVPPTPELDLKPLPAP
jgi:murein DD-endopeptidase MepM/ murein hydrolase activator NlpD